MDRRSKLEGRSNNSRPLISSLPSLLPWRRPEEEEEEEEEEDELYLNEDVMKKNKRKKMEKYVNVYPVKRF